MQKAYYVTTYFGSLYSSDDSQSSDECNANTSRLPLREWEFMGCDLGCGW